MRSSFFRFAIPWLALSAFGAGCIPELASPNVAQPFGTGVTDDRVTEKLGFGALPQIPVPASDLRVTIDAPIPTVPQNITVLRLKSGAPNEAQLLNMASSLGIPGGTLGTELPTRDALLSWTDNAGVRWSYRASSQELSFVNPAATGTKLSTELPSADVAIQTSNAFLQSRMVKLNQFREPILEPDWTLWWETERAAGRCMDVRSIQEINKEADADFPLTERIAPLPFATRVACTTAQFPGRMTVRYRMFVDGRDVIRNDGSFVSGAEVAIHGPSRTAANGVIRLSSDPDRSDYPAISTDTARAALLAGGLSGASGSLRVTEFEFSSLAVPNPSNSEVFLIPSLVGIGERTRPDGTTGSFRIVIPLIAR
jgi:hypothetical protein